MSAYRERAAREIREQHPGATVTPIMRGLVADSARMLARGRPGASERAAAARAHAVANLEALHAQLRESFGRQGIGYHRAVTSEEAVATVRRLLGDAKRVAKSKTMVGEEVGLTHALRAAGLDVLETDIGEYIVDVEGRGPSHITAPALHLDRSRIRTLLARTGADLPDDDPVRLSRYVRDVVGAYFQDCDAGITGANAVVASSGRVMVVENEGNVSLGVSHPKLHVAITGLEKVVADEAAALAILEVLAPSATAQPLTSFSHFLAAPMPGQERHVVFVDNGRSAIAADARYRDVLKCIRCGACMNGCPVYRAAGGLSYQSPYMGPIGAVISPLLWPDGRFADLPFASSLCGRCTEACPVGIPLHRMLLDLRGDAVERHEVAGRAERIAWRTWAVAFGGATRARAVSAAARIGLRSGGRLFRANGTGDDPRTLPDPAPTRDPANLQPVAAAPTPQPVVQPETEPDSLLELFRVRAAALGVEVVEKCPARKGDRLLTAAAGVASTGSVLLVGDQAARRPLLAAKRVVVQLDPANLVRYPGDLEPYLGEGDALILTGASRTADIEKQIVRGIHGSEELAVVLRRE
jgi:L-lactate dehydrogenase complex protein LldF